MSPANSLLDADARQGELVAATGGKVADYTGEYLFLNRRAIYDACARMLAESASKAQISRVLGISRNTVAGVARREMGGQTLEQLKAGASIDARHVAALTVDRARELLTDPTVSFKARDLGGLAAMLKTATEAGELLAGQATSIIKHTADPSADDFEAAIRRAKRARLDVDMGCVGETAEHSRRADRVEDAPDTGEDALAGVQDEGGHV